MTFAHALTKARLYWGLAAIFAVGVATSPTTLSGENIFLSPGNLLDVLRQVSITGLVATGMTAVILTAGIDLSVGSVLALCTVVTAMLLTIAEPSPALALAAPSFVLVLGLVGFLLARFVLANIRARSPRAPSSPQGRVRRQGVILPLLVGVTLASAGLVWLMPQWGARLGVLPVLLIVPCVGLLVGAINGVLIVAGRLQPFIVTLAMMVTALGVARLTAGQNSAVVPVYTGANATVEFEVLRASVFGLLPLPGLLFLGAIIVYWAVLRLTPFGRYVYAVGGNEDAARLSGVPVGAVKISTYALSGFLAGLAGILYVAQYRQGKPDAGSGLELDAIAAVVIGGASLMGGRGGLAGTFCGVLIFGLLSNLPQLHNINSNLQLVLKGAIIIIAVLLQERPLRLWPSGPRRRRVQDDHSKTTSVPAPDPPQEKR